MPQKLPKKKLEMVAEKIMDWGNLVFVGLVIGQLVPGTTPFRWSLLLLGLLGITSAYTIAYYLMMGKGVNSR